MPKHDCMTLNDCTYCMKVLSYNMVFIVTSIKSINPSYVTIVCAHPGSATCYFCYRYVLCRLSLFQWLICVSLRFCHCIDCTDWCIDLFSCTAAAVFNKLTYLSTYLTQLRRCTQHCIGTLTTYSVSRLLLSPIS